MDKVPHSLFFFLFVVLPFLSALPCYCTREACTGPACTFSVLLSIVQTIYTVTHLLSKIRRLHLLHLFSCGNLAILQIILLPVLRPFYVSRIFFLMGSQNRGLHRILGEDEVFFQRQLYLLFFALPGAVAVYFLLAHIPKLFQNMIFSLVPNSWLPSPSGIFPYQVWEEAREQLGQGHKQKGLQSRERQCHITSSLCRSSSRDATALGHWPKQHLPCRDWPTPHISWPNGEHQQLHLPKCNVHACGWCYEPASTRETESLRPEYCKPAWGSSCLKGRVLNDC